ncbi:MAG: hypothetical protein RRY20_04970 [Bilophila sp.]
MLLAFMLVLFGGLAFMFFCISRSQEALQKAMREDHAQLEDRLTKLEAHVRAGFGSLNGFADEREYAPPTLNQDSAYPESQPFSEGSSPLDAMNLQLEPTASPTSSRTPHRESGLPDLKM